MLKMRLILREIRIYQWVKNALIFVPCIAGHTIFISNNLFVLFFSFLFFSLTASSGYILNDIVDLDQDRAHPIKKFRPIAAGTMSLKNAIALQILLLILGIVGAFLIDEKLPVLLLIYFTASATYTFFFKKLFLADLILLSGLYIFRIYVGAVVGNIILSKWLITFSGVMFLCLAVMKRYGEVYRFQDGAQNTVDKLYTKSHGLILKILGFSAAILSVLVFVRYLFSQEASTLYRSPLILIFTCVAIEAWLLRMWYFALKGRMTSDPIVFALRDPVSYISVMIIFISIWWAI